MSIANKFLNHASQVVNNAAGHQKIIHNYTDFFSLVDQEHPDQDYSNMSHKDASSLLLKRMATTLQKHPSAGSTGMFTMADSFNPNFVDATKKHYKVNLSMYDF